MKIYYKYFLVITIIMCSLQVVTKAQTVDLRGGTKVQYFLGISFNKEAVESKAYMTFKVVYDKEALDIAFSQGKFSNNELKLWADKFENIDKDGNDGLLMTITPVRKLKTGTYSVKIELIDKSPDLEIENGSLDFKVNNISIIPDEPVPFWKRLIVISAILFLLVIFFYILITVKKRFPKGIVQIIDGGTSTEVTLKGKSRFSLANEISDFPYDFILGKKIFGYYQGPVVVKTNGDYEVSKNTGEAIGVGSVLYSEETVIINYSEKIISIYYNH